MLELLKAAADRSRRSDSNAMPDDRLGFMLHYPAPADVDAERTRIADLIGGDGFDLFPYSAEQPQVLVLNFPDIPIGQSPEYLFETAEDLRRELDLVAVTPEIGPAFADGEAAGAMVESFGGLLDIFCLSSAASPDQARWADRMIRGDVARANHGVTGQGVRVAQPDTGVATHREIERNLNIHLGHNYLDGVRDPTDPLSSDMAAPGHGTRTSSQVIARGDLIAQGTAPGAELVPLRALNSVVIGAGRAVARSVDHARVNGCHVVTMSLGGPFAGLALRQAIERAVEAHLIVLAAAGNCVGKVTYPASDANVIAVAGLDQHGNRWRGSCRGRAVDVSAPGENVHVATRLPGDGGTAAAQAAIERRGQGTSYAVALTAGVAALWLEKVGRDNAIAEAQSRGVFVQDLFRAALRATARAPGGWDSANLGTGIVDADALLDMGLADIPAGAGVEAPLIADLMLSDVPVALQAEASFVAMDWAIRQSTAPDMLENALPIRPTPAVAALLGRTAPEAFPAPVVIAEPTARPEPTADALRRLATGRGGGLESAAALDGQGALDRLRSEGAQAILDDAEAALAARAAARPGEVDTGTQGEALARIAPVIEGLMTAEPDLGDRRVRAALEALVRLTGRPALRVTGQELDDPLIGTWRDTLRPIRHRWGPHVAAVGRIDVEVSPGNWVHAGTGYRISDTHILTNRHVLDAFVEQLPSLPGTNTFHARRPASIIFDAAAADESRRFALGQVVTAGAERIGRFVDLAKLDLAVFEMETDNGSGTPPPPVVPGDPEGLDDLDLRQLLIAGYPAEPRRPADIDDDDAFWARIDEIYGDVYGVKYISPGFVMARPGEVAGDPRGWTFTHDATTLAGNSGSVIVGLHGQVPLIGLHFGGMSETRNYAHDLTRVAAGADGAFDVSVLPGGAG